MNFHRYKAKLTKFIKKIILDQSQLNRYPMTPEAIIWGYRLFLDREPESQRMIEDKLRRLYSTRDIRYEFLRSEEFKQRNDGMASPALTGFEPPMTIDEVMSDDDLQLLFTHVQDTWQYLGEVEPHWSVISADNLKQTNLEDATINNFYESGKHDVARFINTLERNGVDTSSFKLCLEYGCGLGRVTRWLAERFEEVIGCDISQSHLQYAKNYLSDEGIRNVTLRHLNTIEGIEDLLPVDVVYSIIVLQHNPPPIIELIIRNFIKTLKPGGVAYFQVPTYKLGYNFSLKDYLSGEAKHREIEMHYLPQKTVYEIVNQEGGQILEVLEDSWIHSHYYENSNTFLVQKRQ